MIFLASPYSDPDPWIREQRFKATCKVAAIMIKDGKHVFSPIAHSHPIAVNSDLPLDAGYWWNFNVRMLNNCSEVVVLCLPLWRESVGVRREINLAMDLGIPVRYTTEVNLDLTTFKILND